MTRIAPIRSALCALLLIGLLITGCGTPYQFRGGTIEPPDDARDFTLTDQRGQPFRLSDLRESVVVLFFGFTNCPDVCPTTLAEMKAARAQLGADGERVRVVLITVDPERDTPDRLARYVAQYDPTFIGLTGSQEELAAVYKAYGIYAEKRDLPGSGVKYTVDHTATTFVIDAAGKRRVLIPFGSPIADIVSDLRHLVRTT